MSITPLSPSRWVASRLADRRRCPRTGRIVSAVRHGLAVVARMWLRRCQGFEVEGREHLPAAGPFVLIANHASHLDALCLLSLLPLSRLDRAFPAAAADYFFQDPLRALAAIVAANAVAFDRRGDPLESLEVCSRLLESSESFPASASASVVILFPEGTRSGGEGVAEFKPGVGRLVAGRSWPVVPCHISGTDEVLPRGRRVPRRGAIAVRVGRPRTYELWSQTRQTARQIAGDLRRAVLELADRAPARAGGD